MNLTLIIFFSLTRYFMDSDLYFRGSFEFSYLFIQFYFLVHHYSAIGWRFGLQLITVTVFLTFFLATCYRSASLYHPQRRAILHLKNQKRKIKDKNKIDDKPPFIDFSTLKSKTVRYLLLSTGVGALGVNTPIFHLVSKWINNLYLSD